MDDIQIVKRRLIRNLRKTAEELEQMARDMAWWNENRTDAPPFDNGGELVAADLARQMLQFVENDRPIPDSLSKRYFAQLHAIESK